jgi:hypothetical protein
VATNYPGSADTFNVPSLPESTSLSSAGTGSRAHTDHHKDLGDAVVALENNAAQKTHDHSGGSGFGSTPKLAQANTHESPDTNASTSALHHTLGTGAFQAAPGNHTHDYNTLTNTPWKLCTSSTRPTPYLGLMIYETDTNAVRVWAQFPDASSPSWRILPIAAIPNVRLRQTVTQQLNHTGTLLAWQSELEDNFGFFNSAASQTDIVVKESGMYHIDAAIQWDPNLVPDTAFAVVCVNTQETTVRNQQFMRGELFTPGFSQTLAVTGKIRLAVNDIIQLKARYTASGGLLSLIFSFFDTPSKIQSRIDITFLGP